MKWNAIIDEQYTDLEMCSISDIHGVKYGPRADPIISIEIYTSVNDLYPEEWTN